MPFKSQSTCLIISIFCACLTFTAHAQTDSVTAIRYLVTHNWSKKMAAVDYISAQRRERIAYMWGNRSEWKVYTQLYFSETESRYIDSEERAEPEDQGYSWRRDKYSIQRDYQRGVIFDVIEMLGKVYVVEDSIHAPDWKVKNDLKEVAGHVCMNATWHDTLKNQTVDVWFALDLPGAFGPERLCGLPGVILEVDVNNGGMIMVADKIETLPRSTLLDRPKKAKGKKVAEAEYLARIREHMKTKREAEEPPFWGIRY
jgi:GLPGLI family protein